MNDAWDPLEELEPLDNQLLGLLTAYRDTQGPSQDAEARMLAGLRARVEAEDARSRATTATAAPNVTATDERSSFNTRTFAIAAIAFAAGVALTVSLPGSAPAETPSSALLGSSAQTAPRDHAESSPGRPRSLDKAVRSASADPTQSPMLKPMA
ncbi:MAG: hypothetical protein KUG77_02380, partial [Nannocystaceae bacterium]|nr:hypothetical protein [Nannocystaceae bacterium]